MIPRCCRSGAKLSDGQWSDLWLDIATLQGGAFSQLSLEELLQQFCRTLLLGGRYVLAATYMEGAVQNLSLALPALAAAGKGG